MLKDVCSQGLPARPRQGVAGGAGSRPPTRSPVVSPRTALSAGEPVQAFTTIGRIKPGNLYQADTGGGFHPVRRDVAWRQCRAAPIHPLLDRLSFTKGKAGWGYAFRRGSFAVDAEDFAVIAEAMGVDLAA